MDLQKLYYLKHWLEYSSFTFNLESYVVLTNSLLLLQSENHFKKIFIWGTIQGLDADYYIAFGYEKDALAGRRYFYSDDCQSWKLLPVPEKEHLILTELCKRPFQGDPGLVVEVVDDAPSEDLFPDQNTSGSKETAGASVTEEQIEPNFETVEEEEKLSKLSNEQNVINDEQSTNITSGELKEEDRLAAIVHIISEEAAVVPRGGIFKQTDGICIHSRAFEGIKLDDADSLCSFQHYRFPRNDCNTNLMIRCDYNYAIDFLDTIDKDIPEDCWSAQLVEGDRTIILRNLYWPGFMSFHYLDSPDYGFIYLGQGHRNLDIPFMTQVSLRIQPEDSTEVPAEEEENLRTSVASLHSELSRETRLPTTLSKSSTKRNTTLNEKTNTKRDTTLIEKTNTKLDTTLNEKTNTKQGSELSIKTDV